MIELSIDEVAQALEARVTGKGKLDDRFPSVSIDSRSIQPGQCFLAIKGPLFDGHDFSEEALRKGASILIHSRDSKKLPTYQERVFLQVKDTSTALQVLAHYVRQKWGRLVLAISGSMGKTTTRQFAACLLSQRMHVFQSPGNLNNEIGVPLSLLELTHRHELALLELGMSHSGEIRNLARICCPDFALLTNVAPVHLESFTSIEEIAEAKAEILENLPSSGTFFFNADDPRLCRIAQGFTGNKVSFGLAEGANVRISAYRFEDLDRMSFTVEAYGQRIDGTVSFLGKHLLYDLAAAVAIALRFDLTEEELSRGIAQLQPPPMRGRILSIEKTGGGSITLWDDSYNSNPEALHLVLEAFGQLTGFRRKVLALGEMLELGPGGPDFHREAGRSVAESRPDLLVTVGAEGRYISQGAQENSLAPQQIRHFESSEEAADYLERELTAGDLLLVKGSRGVNMDHIVGKIIEGRETQ